jgi:hypothetical protein
MPEHVDIADGERHEPKGASTATVGQVYVSDGAASGSWEDFAYDINTVLADVSHPSFVLVPILNDSVVTQIKYVLGGAITASNSTITVTRGGGSAMGTQVITQAASAEGTTFTQTPSGNNDITAATHHYIKIATDGASSNSTPLYITVRCRKIP